MAFVPDPHDEYDDDSDDGGVKLYGTTILGETRTPKLPDDLKNEHDDEYDDGNVISWATPSGSAVAGPSDADAVDRPVVQGAALPARAPIPNAPAPIGQAPAANENPILGDETARRRVEAQDYLLSPEQSNCDHKMYGAPLKHPDNHTNTRFCHWRTGDKCYLDTVAGLLFECRRCRLLTCRRCWDAAYRQNKSRTGVGARDNKRRLGTNDVGVGTYRADMQKGREAFIRALPPGLGEEIRAIGGLRNV